MESGRLVALESFLLLRHWGTGTDSFCLNGPSFDILEPVVLYDRS